MTNEPNGPFLAFEDAFAFLRERTDYERGAATARRSPHLESIREIVAALDHPERAYPTAHITGTKGKGSTAHFLSRILSFAGLRVGLYTSPHLQHPLERIRIAGETISGGLFAEIITELREVLRRCPKGEDASFFDLMTAAAFLAFRRAEIDLGVIEVGLGGRLDSTNVIFPRVCILTSISYDHTRILGERLDQIAGEKAGIFKSGVPIVCGLDLDHPALETILAGARENQAPILLRGRDFGVRSSSTEGGGMEVDIDPGDGSHWHGRFPSAAPFQARNLSMALAAARLLSEQGLGAGPHVFRPSPNDLSIPGRFEWLAGEVPILLDGAHNTEAFEALGEALRKELRATERGAGLVGVLAIARDKIRPGLFRPISTLVDIAFTTRIHDNPRSLSPEELADCLSKEGIPARAEPDTRTALEKALEEARKDGGPRRAVLVTGSLYLVGEVRRMLLSDGRLARI